MKSLLPIILIIVAGGIFFLEINPLYTDVKILRAESKQYDEALRIADQLEDLRTSLSSTLESFSDADLARLDHFLPSNLDTVRIVLDLDGMAARNGLKLTNLLVGAGTTKAGTATTPAAGKSAYESVDVSFSFTSTYPQGVKFIEDVEKSLRLLDSAGVKVKPSANSSSLYDFSLSLKAFWMNR